MSQFPNRAALWLNKLAPDAPLMSGLCPSVQVADGQIDGESVRFIAVVPDANNHYPRAAGGEVGLLEGWTLAKVVNETIAADADQPVKRPIVAVIDVPSQAYGRREEALVFTRRWPGGRRLCQSPSGRPSGDWPDRRQSDVRGVSGPRLPGQPPDRL
jgi:hypothetical protein